MVSAGATWLDQQLVQDGNLITSRGPQDLVPFVKGIIRDKDGAAFFVVHALADAEGGFVKRPALH